MVAHEYAHGWAAKQQGDLTAYQLGRLTWNPLKHIDPFMTILLPLFLAWVGGPIFGGAKPVPVNPRNYRDYKKGDIIVSLAGVTTNVIVAILSVPAILIVGLIGEQLPGIAQPLRVLQVMLHWSVFINLLLAAFNLLPIPPLDGSHVFKYLLPPKWAIAYQQAGRYGLLILFGFLYFGRGVLMIWLTPVYVLQRYAEELYLPFMLATP